MLAANPPKDAIKQQEAGARLSKMRFQNQGLKTGSFTVTHGRTPIVASMLFVFSMRETCLQLKHVLTTVLLVSFPSEVVE